MVLETAAAEQQVYKHNSVTRDHLNGVKERTVRFHFMAILNKCKNLSSCLSETYVRVGF